MNVSGVGYSITRLRVFSPRDYALYVLLSLTLIASLATAVLRWFLSDIYLRDPIAWAGLSAIASIIIGNQIARWALLSAMRRPGPPPVAPVMRIAAVTAFVPGAEPLIMLGRSLAALVALDLPHDTWVLDEGDDCAARALCEQYGALHFTRKGKSQFHSDSGRFASGSKHGNYNAWLTEVGLLRYDVVSAFDIDHVPAPSFLSETLGYFKNPRIGYVQAAQAYYNQNASLIARGAAEETYEFYSVVQMANYRLGYPAVIGCHNTHRMEALASVEGFAAHDADDLLITLRYRQAGWEGVYVSRILARGVVPVEWRTYLTQQRRWSRAVLDLKLRRQWEYLGHLPPLARMAAVLHGINYIQPCLVAVLGIPLLAWMLLHPGTSMNFSSRDIWTLASLIVVIVMCHAFRQRFFLDPVNESGVPWRSWLLRFAKWPFILLALVDVLRDKKYGYVMTPKVSTAGGNNPLLWGHAPGLALVTAAWLLAILRGVQVSTVALLFAGTFIALTLGTIVSGWALTYSPFAAPPREAIPEDRAEALRTCAEPHESSD